MLTNIVAPAIAGLVLASLSLFGLVSSSTSAPEKNPAANYTVDYGSR